MKVIPAVDIRNGCCVKLVQGRPGTGLTVSKDPVEVAEHWVEEGAEVLHVVDLDGAIDGVAVNRPLILEIIRRVDVPVQVGGGIRSLRDALSLVESGAYRIVLGTVVYENPRLFRLIVDSVGADKIIVAIDSKSGFVVKRGWTESAGVTVYDVLHRLDPDMFWGLLYTDVEHEGLASGIDVKNLKRLLSVLNKPLIYAGGVSSLSDIAVLRDLGVYGVVIGKALYTGLFSLREAMEAARDD